MHKPLKKYIDSYTLFFSAILRTVYHNFQKCFWKLCTNNAYSSNFTDEREYCTQKYGLVCV